MLILAIMIGCNEFQMLDNETIYIDPEFDIFKTTESPPGVDIVVVADASGSMTDNWPYVYEQLPDFQLALAQLNTQWRFTTISADRTAVTPLSWITSTTPNLAWDMTAQFQAVQNQNGELEAGLDASFTFASEHPEVLMPQNDLYFVFLSDEADQSSMDPNTWLNLFSTFKYLPNASVGAGAIVETGQGCGDFMGDGYLEVSQKTIDLCDTGWGDVLDPVVNRLEPEDGIFTLNVEPDPSSIKVYLEDRETDYWEYYADLNSIQLDVIPPTNTTVIITYYPAN